MSSNVSFDTISAKIIFEKLYGFYPKEEVDSWKIKLDNDVNNLFEKYNVINYKLNKKSYMGLVMECQSTSYGQIIIKIVPPMINRYKTEIGTLERLPKQLTCNIYECVTDKNAIIMEQIVPGSLADFDSNEELMSDLFKTLYNNKIHIDQFINENFKDFNEVVKYDYNICKLKTEDLDLVNYLYSRFNIKYNELCKDKEQYLLHGDVYKNNILLSNDGLKIIDPLGFKAPFIIELVSICAYELFNSENKNNYDFIVNKFIDFFKDYVDEQSYRKALFCQLIKVFIPSIYEANDGGIRAQKWLDIIKILYPEELK